MFKSPPIVQKDFLHFRRNYPYLNNSKKSFVKLFLKSPEFRALMDYRFKKMSLPLKLMRILTYPSKVLLNCYISSKTGNIGGGLLLEHAFATIINVESMGENCHVYQQVTIGWANGGQPTIGNDVTICAGSLVLGAITIGDDVIIGAGSVVVKDIPSHSIVVGNPARVIKKRNRMNDSWVRV